MHQPLCHHINCLLLVAVAHSSLGIDGQGGPPSGQSSSVGAPCISVALPMPLLPAVPPRGQVLVATLARPLGGRPLNS